MTGRGGSVVSLERLCCNEICRHGVGFAESAIEQLPADIATELLVSAVKAQQYEVVACIVSVWPLNTLRYVWLSVSLSISESVKTCIA